MANKFKRFNKTNEEIIVKSENVEGLSSLLGNKVSVVTGKQLSTNDFTDVYKRQAKENEKYLDSIAGKLSQFEAQFESLSTSVVDSGLPKFFIELGTNVLSATEGIINFIDVFPALMGLLSGGLSLTGQKAGKSNMPSYASCDLIAA